MGYVYSVLWLIIALTLFLRFRKENKSVILLSLYFVFLSVWWFLDQFVHGLNLMDGDYIWILRSVSALMLGLCVIVYIRERKKDKNDSTDTDSQASQPTTDTANVH